MMAPVSRSSSATLQNNGYKNDPPPSTMAAQLIHGISTTKQPAQPADQGYLQSIMAEVSSMENSAVKPQDPALQLAHKHKLIYVLARALLEKLGGDDPFLDIEQAVSQASEALDVFTTTVKEFPDVLDYVLPSGTTLQARGTLPLWVWLFPRVLTLLGQKNCENLTERIHNFFSVAFQVVSHSPRLWNLASVFFVYLKECVASTYFSYYSLPFYSH
jgi:serine/threonine-protein kinase ATR